ncbi:MAG: hypothetical protein Q7J42_16755 [Sulfuritalea sp.]|nr:hypothetical protein [Sulfuritalea sp.]
MRNEKRNVSDPFDGANTPEAQQGADWLDGGTARSISAGKAVRREAGSKAVISVSYFLAIHTICSPALNNPKEVMGNSGFRSRRWRHGDSTITAANDGAWRKAA